MIQVLMTQLTELYLNSRSHFHFTINWRSFVSYSISFSTWYKMYECKNFIINFYAFEHELFSRRQAANLVGRKTRAIKLSFFQMFYIISKLATTQKNPLGSSLNTLQANTWAEKLDGRRRAGIISRRMITTAMSLLRMEKRIFLSFS